MRLATRGYDEFHTAVEERPAAIPEDRAKQIDEIDRTLSAMSRAPTLIALIWLTFYLVIAFSAFTR
jgi:hypothetical protein